MTHAGRWGSRTLIRSSMTPPSSTTRGLVSISGGGMAMPASTDAHRGAIGSKRPNIGLARCVPLTTTLGHRARLIDGAELRIKAAERRSREGRALNDKLG